MLVVFETVIHLSRDVIPLVNKMTKMHPFVDLPSPVFMDLGMFSKVYESCEIVYNNSSVVLQSIS